MPQLLSWFIVEALTFTVLFSRVFNLFCVIRLFIFWTQILPAVLCPWKLCLVILGQLVSWESVPHTHCSWLATWLEFTHENLGMHPCYSCFYSFLSSITVWVSVQVLTHATDKVRWLCCWLPVRMPVVWLSHLSPKYQPTIMPEICCRTY